MEYRNYKFRTATLTDVPELQEMFKTTLRTINKLDYTPEEIFSAFCFVGCGNDDHELPSIS